MTDIQAEINAKEKCQEQLNIIYQNAQILNQTDATTKFQQSYLDQLQADIDTAWATITQIGNSMCAYKDIAVPKALDVTAMTDAGIIPDTPQ